jgi:PAS domain S-box-containing protein
MQPLQVAEQIVLWTGAIVSLSLAINAWRRRRTLTGAAFVTMMAGVFLHCVVQGFHGAMPGLWMGGLPLKLNIIAWDVATGAFLILAVAYTGRASRLRNPVILVLLAFRVASIVVVLTSRWHSWVLLDFDPEAPSQATVGGQWIPIGEVSSLASSLVALGFLASLAVQVPAYYRDQALTMALAGLLPAAAAVVHLAVPESASGLRIVPLSFAGSGLLMALAVRRYGALEVVPIARDVIFSRVSDAILVCADQGTIADLNPRAALLLGMPVDRAIGRSIAEVAAGCPELVDLVLEGRAGESEISAVEPRGLRYFATQVTAIYPREGEAGGTAVLLHDITDRREVELALRKANHDLQALGEMRDDLTHLIVHDLRTPLTSVLSGIKTLELAGELNEAQRELLTMAIQGGETLLGMINDLLDISKMEGGSLTLARVATAASDLVERAAAQVQALMAERDLRLLVDLSPELPLVDVDQDLMVRTLVNLVGNACKYTPGGGSITVRASLDGPRTVLFEVSDTGVGIPEEAQGRIFEKFGQVEDRKAGQRASTGLGLTLCKLAVEAHGGRIWVRSAPGEGSTFSFTVPSASAP